MLNSDSASRSADRPDAAAIGAKYDRFGLRGILAGCCADHVTVCYENIIGTRLRRCRQSCACACGDRGFAAEKFRHAQVHDVGGCLNRPESQGSRRLHRPTVRTREHSPHWNLERVHRFANPAGGLDACSRKLTHLLWITALPVAGSHHVIVSRPVRRRVSEVDVVFAGAQCLNQRLPRKPFALLGGGEVVQPDADRKNDGAQNLETRVSIRGSGVDCRKSSSIRCPGPESS